MMSSQIHFSNATDQPVTVRVGPPSTDWTKWLDYLTSVPGASRSVGSVFLSTVEPTPEAMELMAVSNDPLHKAAYERAQWVKNSFTIAPQSFQKIFDSSEHFDSRNLISLSGWVKLLGGGTVSLVVGNMPFDTGKDTSWMLIEPGHVVEVEHGRLFVPKKGGREYWFGR